MWQYRHNNYQIDLYHYGVKGMKWGVRRTPEQLGHIRVKKRLTNTVVNDTIKSGKISTKVNMEKQSRHISGSKRYKPGRSRMFGSLADAQRLITELSGTGSPILVKGIWNYRERVSASNIIGVYVNQKTGKETKTNKAMIIYSKTGSHIYPREPEKGVL